MKCVFRSCLGMVRCAWYVVSCETTFDVDRVGLEPRAQARRAAEPFVIGWPTGCRRHKRPLLNHEWIELHEWIEIGWHGPLVRVA